MILHFMDTHGICTIIHADFQKESVTIENHTDDILHRAFGIKERPTWADFEKLLTEANAYYAPEITQRILAVLRQQMRKYRYFLKK